MLIMKEILVSSFLSKGEKKNIKNSSSRIKEKIKFLVGIIFFSITNTIKVLQRL